ncbi:DUF6538 domain-containing protein [Paraburkholderia caledonica]|uniref:DUF6538 domain-containing protein n=1 Tax=Paraburkholderia caledonica TaxID=134536 RepID=UPI000483F048|nr:DUF6538 domain-containing protein [Paraburkholderia caledonica]
MTNYRSKRGNCYYFRRKIPLELQTHFGGRKEVVKALGTSDPSTADALCREHAVVYDTLFENARRSTRATESARASVDAAQRGAIAEQRDDWERAQLAHIEEADRLSYQTEEQEFAEHDRQESRFEALVWEEQQRLKARIEAQRRLGGQHAGVTQTPGVGTLPQKVARATETQGKTLRDVIPSWTRRTSADPSTVKRAQKALTLFEEAVGKVPLRELRKAHGAQFVAFLLDDRRGFTAKTAGNHASYISALLNVGVKDDWIDRNPLDRTFDKTVGAQKRVPWSEAELKLLYGHPLFSKRMNDVPEWQGVRPTDGRALLLILQHTGARIGEIAQLRRCDFQVQAGITTIRITDEAGAIKTAESERTVPLADNLLADEWFSAWLARIMDGTRNDAAAFPSMAGRARGPADTSVQWFRQFRKAAGLPPGTLNGSHKFRHWIRTAMNALDVAEATQDAITGHAVGGSTGKKVYTHVPVPIMHAALNRLAFPTLFSV